MKKLIIFLLAAALLAGLLCSCVPNTERQVAKTMTLYLPNDDATGYRLLPCEGDASPEAIVEALVDEGVLPEGTEALSFVASGDALALDLNETFLEAVTGKGIAGETMVIGSVVNSFLCNHPDAVTIMLTVEGVPIETGHNVYDQPFSFQKAD